MMVKKITICLVLLLLVAFAGCESQSAQAPELLEPVTVKADTAVAYYGDIYDISVYSAEVVPHVEELYFLVDGALDELKVMVGDQVQEGDMLATLSSETIRSQIESLEAEIANTEKLGEFDDRLMTADIEIAKAELESMRYYASSAAIKAKQIEVEQFEAKLSQAVEIRQLALDHLNGKLEALKGELQNAQITAPFSGKVVYVTQLEKGDRVGSFSTVICLVDESRLQICSDFISEYTVTNADKIVASIADREYEIAYLPMDTDEYYAMILSGGERKTEFALVDGAEALVSGQFAAVTVMDNYKSDVLLVPINALYRDEKGSYVYKLVNDARVRQDVKVGMTTGIEAEIIEGLQEGDIVYVKG